MDTKAAKSFLNKLANNTTSYTAPQESRTVSKNNNRKAKSSKGSSIIVLNGSRISGLAAATQERLNADGFSVNQIGDYTDETLTRTRIIVKENGIGNDLAGYFADPEIVTGDVREGFDIEIIIGTADAN